MSVVGNYAYLATGDSGLQIINIFNPSEPILMGTYDTDGYASGVSVIGNYAYVADGNEGLQIINISNPSAPILMVTYDTIGYAYDVSVIGNYAYVADGSGGLSIIKVKMTDTDTDNDGISDVYEITLGFDPFDANSKPLDSDADGTPDALDEDDDNDGISDRDEAAALGFNPRNPSDGLADADGDGFSNALEFSLGTNLNSAKDKPVWAPVMMGGIVMFIPGKV